MHLYEKAAKISNNNKRHLILNHLKGVAKEKNIKISRCFQFPFFYFSILRNSIVDVALKDLCSQGISKTKVLLSSVSCVSLASFYTSNMPHVPLKMFYVESQCDRKADSQLDKSKVTITASS